MQIAMKKDVPLEQGHDAALPPLRVLIVDDSEALTKTLAWMIEILGHEVRIANDGETALTIAQEFLPELMLFDIGLPGMSGYELCAKIRQVPALKHSMIIAQTGWDRPEHRQKTKEAGFDDHFVKPVPIEKMEELFQKIQESRVAA